MRSLVPAAPVVPVAAAVDIGARMTPVGETPIPVAAATDAAGRRGVVIRIPQGRVVSLPPTNAREVAARIVAAAAEVDGSRH